MRFRNVIELESKSKGLDKSRRDVQKVTSALSGVQKAAGAVGVALSVGAAVGFVKRISSEAINLASTMSDVALQTKTSIEGFQTLSRLAEDAGTNAEVMARALRNINNRSAMAENNPFSEYGNAIARLGINLDEFNKLNTEQKLEAIARGFVRAGQSTQALEATARILGEEAGPKLQEVLVKLANSGLAGYTQAMKEANQIMSEDTVLRLDAAKQQWEEFWNQIVIITGEALGKLDKAMSPANEGLMGQFNQRSRDALSMVGQVQTSEDAKDLAEQFRKDLEAELSRVRQVQIKLDIMGAKGFQANQMRDELVQTLQSGSYAGEQFSNLTGIDFLGKSKGEIKAALEDYIRYSNTFQQNLKTYIADLQKTDFAGNSSRALANTTRPADSLTPALTGESETMTRLRDLRQQFSEALQVAELAKLDGDFANLAGSVKKVSDIGKELADTFRGIGREGDAVTTERQVLALSQSLQQERLAIAKDAFQIADKQLQLATIEKADQETLAALEQERLDKFNQYLEALREAADLNGLISAQVEEASRNQPSTPGGATPSAGGFKASGNFGADIKTVAQDSNLAAQSLQNVSMAFAQAGLQGRDFGEAIQMAFQSLVMQLVSTIIYLGIIAALLKAFPALNGLFTTIGLVSPYHGGRVPGRSAGGYTGDGGKYAPAGIVHGGEYVFSKRDVANLGIANIEAFRGGNFPSGGGGQQSFILVDNRNTAQRIARTSSNEALITNVIRKNRNRLR